MTSYRIHAVDKPAKTRELADVISNIPAEQMDYFLAEANKMLSSSRDIKFENSYIFENFLIAEAEKHIARGDPVMAYWHCLREGNHGNSGFTNTTRRIYMRPGNDIERNVSENLRKMIISVANALINFDPLSKGVEDIMGDGWVAVCSIYDCLVLLGEEVDLEMVQKLKELIAGCKKFEKKNPEIFKLEVSFTNRFA